MDKRLKKWRKQINKLDGKLLRVLAKRMLIVKKIGKYKKERGIPAFDKQRWQDVLTTRIALGASFGLSDDFVQELYKLIHERALTIEKEISV